jgi:hypothetical protein
MNMLQKFVASEVAGVEILVEDHVPNDMELSEFPDVVMIRLGDMSMQREGTGFCLINFRRLERG